MTMTTSMQRSQIVIPAQGLIEIRDTLTDLLKEFGTDDKGESFCYSVCNVSYIGMHRLSAILPIIGIGRLLCQYRPIVIYCVL